MPETSMKTVNLIREQAAHIERILHRMAGMMAALIGFGIPILVVVVGAIHFRGTLKTELERKLVLASNATYEHPLTWQDDSFLFKDILARNVGEPRRISWLGLMSADGHDVVQIGAPPGFFSLRESLPMRDGSAIVGTLSGAISLEPILFEAMVAAGISVPLAIALFVALWLGPNRIAHLSYARLAEMDRLINKSLVNLNKAQQIARLGSWEQDLTSPLRHWSATGLDLYGFNDGIVEKSIVDWLPRVHPDDRAGLTGALEQNARTGQFQKLQYRLLPPDGATLIIEEQIEAVFDANGVVVGQTGVVQDITTRQTMASQLAQATKMEAIGNLTGGLAHDFNNYLGIIIGNLDLVIEDLPADSAAKSSLDSALQGALSGAELTKSLLAFSRKQPLDPRLNSVNQRIEGMTKILQRTIGNNVALKLVLDPDIWPVRIDGAQFDSCIINLANNARDAMPRGGSLIFSTRNEQLAEDYAKMNLGVAPGDYVLIEVADTGTGMSPETLARVFEPFFTTKGQKHGTGLGLSMVHGFVRQSGGHIKITSEIDYGTVMRIYLPRDAHGVLASTAADMPNQVSAARTETILAVDDNEQMLNTAVAQLRTFGYQVISANSGEAALAILDGRDRHVDLLFTDVVMPGGMNGTELARCARQRRPGLKVLLTSGFPGTVLGELDSGGDIANFSLLSKPYRKEELDRAIRTALESTASQAGNAA